MPSVSTLRVEADRLDGVALLGHGAGAAGGPGVSGPAVAPIPDAGVANPPLLTGGLQHGRTEFVTTLSGVRLDFLTYTCPESVGERLVAETELHEAGGVRPGFERSERRLCFGGLCWRRTGPRQSSRRFGLGYESWEWDGSSADWAGRRLRGTEGYPTRVDVAWDFGCAESLSSCMWVESVRAHAEARGLTVGGSGQGSVWTRYVGAAESSRRLRVYRKDLQDAGWLYEFGPTLRVELVLRHDLAKAWWEVFNRDEEEGIRVAAGHVFEMSGRPVQPQWSDVPVPGVSPAVDAGQLVFQFVKQHAVMLEACRTLGIDVGELAALRRSMWPRDSECRLRQRLAVLGEVPAEEVSAVVRELMGMGCFQ